MSYEIIRSINEKKRTVTSACNNLRPLMYGTTQYGAETPLNDFRASVIVDMLWGNYHYSNQNHLYNIVMANVEATKEYETLEEKIWNWNNTYEKQWVKDNYENNVKELKELIIKVFNETENAPKEEWVLTMGCYYIKKINKRTYSYTTEKAKAQTFGSEKLAKAHIASVGDCWKPVRK